MHQRLKERQLLLKFALKSLKIKDCSMEVDWDILAEDKASPNWEIYPILWHGIDKGRLPSPPEKIANNLEKTYLVLRANAEMQFILIDEILKKARQRGIMVCLLKGIVLSKEYYPELSLRPMGDIDILVPNGSRIEMGNILKEMGAMNERTQGSHDRYVFPEAHDTVVEVHFRLINTESILQQIFFPSAFLEKIPWEGLVEMEGGGFRLPFSFEYDYLHLHALKEGYKSLKWMIDIALIDSRGIENENRRKGKFITNARAMMLDVTSILMGEKDPADPSTFLWKKSIRDGATGKAGRWERLWMALACAVTSPE